MCAICRRSRLLSRGPKLTIASAPTFAPSFAAAGFGSTAVRVRRKFRGAALETAMRFAVSRIDAGRLFRSLRPLEP
jgi:hypothetical protein